MTFTGSKKNLHVQHEKLFNDLALRNGILYIFYNRRLLIDKVVVITNTIVVWCRSWKSAELEKNILADVTNIREREKLQKYQNSNELSKYFYPLKWNILTKFSLGTVTVRNYENTKVPSDTIN